MKKERTFLNRYIIFFIVGSIVEAIRLLNYRVFEKDLGPDLANIASLLIGVIASFLLHSFITWRNRPGSWKGKIVRFSASKWFLWIIKAGLFPLWRNVPGLDCPFYGVTHQIVDALALVIPLLGPPLHNLFTCGWMSLALMDLVIALTVGFLTHDRFSFWKRSGARTQLK
ncbi:GtrA family protein [Patescibacteria group bacterium AH-259-L05]|nr:GtrA family protein [Patescibacteria group bacterium AH-259-L05]